jgi:hypothetical protein
MERLKPALSTLTLYVPGNKKALRNSRWSWS